MQEVTCQPVQTGRKQAACYRACPAGIDVPRYIRAIAAGKFDESLAIIRESIPFPSICGYACFAPCETRCGRVQFDEAVAIRALKRTAAEAGGDRWKEKIRKSKASGKKVAVVGAGPGGLTAAYYLALKGHGVTVFEAKSEAGGMIRWAIPGYRVPREIIDAEIGEVLNVGVEIRTNARVGSVEELRRAGYDAIYVACGAQKSAPLGIAGDDQKDVVGALEFLDALNSAAPLPVGRRVAVIGGGNAATDAARSALRLGAAEVKIFYRRTREEMPAYQDEIDAALEEGVQIEFLSAPAAIEKQGDALKVTFNRMELGAPDKSGRPSPVRKPGFEYSEAFDTVISAIGQQVELAPDFGIASDKSGLITVDRARCSTNVAGVFAGGDAVSGPASIIEAIAHGKLAAASIDRYLGGNGDVAMTLISEVEAYPDLRADAAAARVELPHLPAGMRISTFELVEKTLNGYLARKEANRCLSCDYQQYSVELDFEACKECGYCREVCQMDVFAQGARFNAKGYRPLEVKNADNCVGCMKCFWSCPDFCIEVKGAA